MQQLSIGAVSMRTGYGAPTIRYFEEIGLLPRVERSGSGRRLYRAEHLQRLMFIRNCRDHGLGQIEIRALIGLLDVPEQPCGEITAIVERHLVRLRANLESLTALIAELDEAIHACDGAAVSRCRIVESLGARPDALPSTEAVQG